MSRLARIACAFAAVASFACSSNPPGADGGSGTTGGQGSSGTTGATTGAGTTAGGSTGGASTGATTGGGSSSGGTSGALPFAQFENAYASSLCQAGNACQPEAAYLLAACVAEVEKSGAGAAFAQIATDLDAGLVTYDPIAAEACVQAVGQMGCGLFSAPSPRPCVQMLTGQLSNGATCYDSSECDAGYCTTEYGSACPGSCTAYLAAGADCSDGGQCFPPASCTARVGDGGQVTASLCEPPGLAGAACASGVDCGFPFSCVNGVCSPAGAAGSACGDNTANAYGLSACLGGLYCEALDGGATACAAQVAQGGVCGQDVLNAAAAAAPGQIGGQCAAGLDCVGLDVATSAPGTCEPLSDVDGGCVPATDAGTPTVSGCLNGLVCVAGLCQIPPTTGACSSDPNFPCDPIGYYCDPTSTTCKATSPVGAACASNLNGSDCATGNCDATGHCAAVVPSCVAP